MNLVRIVTLVLSSAVPTVPAGAGAGAVAAAAEAPSDDRFLAGYVAAVLEREFGLPAGAADIRGGVVRLSARGLTGADRGRIVHALARVGGVTRVEVVGEDPPPPPPPPLGAEAAAPAAPASAAVGGKARPAGLLPPGSVFGSLLADPRWPRLSASYRYYIDDEELTDVGAVNFGESLALWRGPSTPGGQWEVGIQGGVFAVFDLDAESKDLVNADYFGGLYTAYRRGDFSALARVAHQSSHLGDEYLLRGDADDRINLSYETVDAILSYDATDALRLYGGAAFIVHKEPDDLERWSARYGAEYRGPDALLGGRLRPVAAVDVRHHAEHDWNADVSVRAGFQLENLEVRGQRLQLLLEYFDGHSPNGQFYDRRIQHIGVGVYLYF